MTLEQLAEFALKRGGSISFSTTDDPINNAQLMSLEVQLTRQPGLGRDEVHRIDHRVSDHELRDARFPVVQLGIKSMVAQVHDECMKLVEEEMIRKALWPRKKKP